MLQKCKNSTRIAQVLLLLICAAIVPSARAQGETVRDDLGRRLDDYITRLAKFGFSGAVLVAKDGEVVLAKGYGLADRERRIPYTPQTVCTIGSITKQFTAAAILKLEMQGKLRVEDPISKYLPGIPPDKAAITLHQLLTHSAGLRGNFGGRDSDPIGRDELVKLVLDAPLASKPGTHFEYSNEGYSLLAAIVERVSSKSYERFLQENLFLPAGMKDTGYVLVKWPAERIAHGYTPEEEWGTFFDKGWGPEGPGWYLKGNGGIHSTVWDMYRWHQALENDSVLSQAEREKYQRPYIAEGPEGRSHYAYGWTVFETPRKSRLIAHNGGNEIFAADFRRYVDEHVVIFAQSNAPVTAIELTQQLQAVVFGGELKMPPAVLSAVSGAFEKFAGRYEVAPGELVEVKAETGRLKLSTQNAAAFAALNGLTAPGSARFSALESRTETITEAGARGDFESVLKAMGGDRKIEMVRRNQGRLWQERRERFGAWKKIVLLGTGPGPMGIGIYARLEFERGSLLGRYDWEDGEFLGMRGFEESPVTTFLSESPLEFVWFDLHLAKPLRVRFDADGTGAVRGLRITFEGGEVTARKI